MSEGFKITRLLPTLFACMKSMFCWCCTNTSLNFTEYQFVVIICRGRGARNLPGIPLELGNHVNSGVASMGGVNQSTPNLQSADITSSSVVDSVSSEGDSITPNSADLEVKDMGTTNGSSNTLGLLTEVGAKGEKDTLSSQNIPTNGHQIVRQIKSY